MTIPRRNVRQKGANTDRGAVRSQQIRDLQHKLSMELEAFLVLREDGSQTQAALAQNQAKSALLKYGPDLHKLATEAGSPTTAAVDRFLASIDALVHSPLEWTDPSHVQTYYQCCKKLEKILS